MTGACVGVPMHGLGFSSGGGGGGGGKRDSHRVKGGKDCTSVFFISQE